MTNNTFKIIRNNVIASVILTILLHITGVLPYLIEVVVSMVQGDSSAVVNYSISIPGFVIGFVAGVMGLLIGFVVGVMSLLIGLSLIVIIVVITYIVLKNRVTD